MNSTHLSDAQFFHFYLTIIRHFQNKYKQNRTKAKPGMSSNKEEVLIILEVPLKVRKR